MNKEYATSVIILAGGKGERFGRHQLPKQMWPLEGKPVCIHTLDAFDASDKIFEMILVVPPEDILNYRNVIQKYSFQKPIKIVGGGDTRLASTAKGVEQVSNDAKFIAIHDSVRCLITTEQINKVIRKAHKTMAACAGTPATDTVKAVDVHSTVRNTLDRRTLWYAQTPQVFRADLYRGCLYQVLKKDLEMTDDASVVEYFGVPVTMVDTGASNIKITYYSDVEIAKAILSMRGDPLA